MPNNFYFYFLTALIPLVIGALYYSPLLFNKSWMKANNFTDKDLEGANMALIFGLSYVFGIFISFAISFMVVHQTSVFGMMMPEVMEKGSTAENAFNSLMATYGDKHRTFSHGAVHGTITAIFLIMPILAINSLFERRGWKYVLIHTGYWLITLALIGGVLSSLLVWG
ncbi:MAG: DUF1761 domain-containing protein [Saprospiraceae bacterium]